MKSYIILGEPMISVGYNPPYVSLTMLGALDAVARKGAVWAGGQVFASLREMQEVVIFPGQC